MVKLYFLKSRDKKYIKQKKKKKNNNFDVIA